MRRLTLRREALAELGTDDLGRVNAGAPIVPSDWSLCVWCEHVTPVHIPTTRCTPPPA